MPPQSSLIYFYLATVLDAPLTLPTLGKHCCAGFRNLKIHEDLGLLPLLLPSASLLPKQIFEARPESHS